MIYNPLFGQGAVEDTETKEDPDSGDDFLQ